MKKLNLDDGAMFFAFYIVIHVPQFGSPHATIGIYIPKKPPSPPWIAASYCYVVGNLTGGSLSSLKSKPQSINMVL